MKLFVTDLKIILLSFNHTFTANRYLLQTTYVTLSYFLALNALRVVLIWYGLNFMFYKKCINCFLVNILLSLTFISLMMKFNFKFSKEYHNLLCFRPLSYTYFFQTHQTCEYRIEICHLITYWLVNNLSLNDNCLFIDIPIEFRSQKNFLTLQPYQN